MIINIYSIHIISIHPCLVAIHGLWNHRQLPPTSSLKNRAIPQERTLDWSSHWTGTVSSVWGPLNDTKLSSTVMQSQKLLPQVTLLAPGPAQECVRGIDTLGSPRIWLLRHARNWGADWSKAELVAWTGSQSCSVRTHCHRAAVRKTRCPKAIIGERERPSPVEDYSPWGMSPNGLRHVLLWLASGSFPFQSVVFCVTFFFRLLLIMELEDVGLVELALGAPFFLHAVLRQKNVLRPPTICHRVDINAFSTETNSQNISLRRLAYSLETARNITISKLMTFLFQSIHMQKFFSPFSQNGMMMGHASGVLVIRRKFR